MLYQGYSPVWLEMHPAALVRTQNPFQHALTELYPRQEGTHLLIQKHRPSLTISTVFSINNTNYF